MPRPEQQKDALLILLQEQFGYVEREKKFEWLDTPPKSHGPSDYPADYRTIVKALCDYRNRPDFCNARPRDGKLSCDFVIEDIKLIIEFDERQHFTASRKIALQNYPLDVLLHFSSADWIKHCENIDAHDNDPPYRDEQRAFYDSIRDIEAFRNGWTLLRIKDGDVDWTMANTETLNNTINHGNHR